jgi:hypothetical protein
MSDGENLCRKVLSSLHCGISVFSAFFSVLFLSGCVDKKNREKGELRSISVLSRNDAGAELLLLKSMGFGTDVRVVQMNTPSRSTAADSETVGFNFYALSAAVSAAGEDAFRKIIPLYAQASASKLRLPAQGNQLKFSDLMSPAVQAVTGRELRFNDASLNLTSPEALLAVLLAEASQLRFVAHSRTNVNNLFLDGLSFRTVGEIPASSKPANAGRRERNSGFSVGDVVVFTDRSSESELIHAALWVDHDVYFEAVPLADSIVFRISSYSQVMEELARRVATDVLQLQMKIVRRAVAWPDVVLRVSQFKDQKPAGTLLIASDAAGRGQPASLQGLTLTLLPEVEAPRGR